MNNSQPTDLGNKRSLQFLAIFSICIFAIAASGKLLEGNGYLLAGLEAILVLFIAFAYRSKPVQFGLSSVFLAFACYLAFLLSASSLSCRCFGVFSYLPPWLTLAIDLFLFVNWGMAALSQLKSKSYLRMITLTAPICLFIGFTTFSVKTKFEDRDSGQIAEMLLTPNENEQLASATSGFFFRSRCASCVMLLPKFESYCRQRGTRGVVFYAGDAKEIPDTVLPKVRFAEFETAFIDFPYAVRISNRKMVQPIGLSDGEFSD